MCKTSGVRRVRQPAGGSRRYDTLRAARAYYVSRRNKKEGTKGRTKVNKGELRLAWQGGEAMVEAMVVLREYKKA
jgi:hypothetical protein